MVAINGGKVSYVTAGSCPAYNSRAISAGSGNFLEGLSDAARALGKTQFMAATTQTQWGGYWCEPDDYTPNTSDWYGLMSIYNVVNPASPLSPLTTPDAPTHSGAASGSGTSSGGSTSNSGGDSNTTPTDTTPTDSGEDETPANPVTPTTPTDTTPSDSSEDETPTTPTTPTTPAWTVTDPWNDDIRDSVQTNLSWNGWTGYDYRVYTRMRASLDGVRTDYYAEEIKNTSGSTKTYTVDFQSAWTVVSHQDVDGEFSFTLDDQETMFFCAKYNDYNTGFTWSLYSMDIV